MFFVVEDSTQWPADPSGPLTPDVTNTLTVPISYWIPSLAGSAEFGFARCVAGTYSTNFETVRIIRSSESDMELPALLMPNIAALSKPDAMVPATRFAIVG
jgi:hypothetical protein